MRRASSLLVGALIVLAACGRGQDPTVSGAAAVGSTTTTPVVDPSGAVTTVAPADTAPTATAAPVGTVPPSGAVPETTVAPGTGVPVDDVPAAVFGPPAAGRYRFHTVGTSNGQPVDSEGDTVVEVLSATDIRQRPPTARRCSCCAS